MQIRIFLAQLHFPLVRTILAKYLFLVNSFTLVNKIVNKGLKYGHYLKNTKERLKCLLYDQFGDGAYPALLVKKRGGLACSVLF
jgi:hypothetical protein